MDQVRHLLTLAALLASIGCGPPRLASGLTDSEGDSGEAGSDSTSTGTTSTTGPTTSTTGEETSDSETSSDTWTTVEFVPRGDDVWAESCDSFAQDCPEGEKCVPYSRSGGPWDSNKCVPIMGDQAPGEPCWYGGVVEATDNCDATSMCWDVMDVDGEPIGTCHSFCTGTADNPECPPGSSCLIGGDSTIAICYYKCDPLVQDCDPGLGCYWANGDFNCIFTTQDLPTGEPCGFINDCAAGHLCTAAETLPSCVGSACCTLFCDVGLGDQQCGLLPGTSCVPFFEEGEAPPGYEPVGTCILAP